MSFLRRQTSLMSQAPFNKNNNNNNNNMGGPASFSGQNSVAAYSTTMIANTLAAALGQAPGVSGSSSTSGAISVGLLMGSNAGSMSAATAALSSAAAGNSGLTGRVFAASLSDAVANSCIDPQLPLPAVVVRCIEYLDGRGLKEVGLYRVPGSASLINKLRNIFDAGIEFDFFDPPQPVCNVLEIQHFGLSLASVAGGGPSSSSPHGGSGAAGNGSSGVTDNASMYAAPLSCRRNSGWDPSSGSATAAASLYGGPSFTSGNNSSNTCTCFAGATSLADFISLSGGKNLGFVESEENVASSSPTSPGQRVHATRNLRRRSRFLASPLGNGNTGNKARNFPALCNGCKQAAAELGLADAESLSGMRSYPAPSAQNGDPSSVGDYTTATNGPYGVTSPLRYPVASGPMSQGASSAVSLLTHMGSIDVHAVAALLKLFLRELTEHVLGPDFMAFSEAFVAETAAGRDPVPVLSKLAASLLPLQNYTLMSILCAHLARLARNSEINKMTFNNLALIFSPSIRIDIQLLTVFLVNTSVIFPLVPVNIMALLTKGAPEKPSFHHQARAARIAAAAAAAAAASAASAADFGQEAVISR